MKLGLRIGIRLVSLVCVVILTLGTFSLAITKSKNATRNLTPAQRYELLFTESIKLEPTVSNFNGTEYIWQIPDVVRGTVFMAHSCNRNASHWWDRHPNCPHCVGLPEERLLVKAALDRKLAVITISSAGPCWETTWPPENSSDTSTVLAVLNTWRKEKGLIGHPLAALGASSGAYFVSMLPHYVHLDSIVLMIASGVQEALQSPLPGDAKYPPTLFVHMVKDGKTARMVRGAALVLKKAGCDIGEMNDWQHPVSAKILSRKIPELGFFTARKIVRVLQEDNILDSQNFMRRDAVASKWVHHIRNYRYRVLPLEGEGETARLHLQSHVEEELNVAFGHHEICSSHAPEIMDWIEGVCVHDGKLDVYRCGNAGAAASLALETHATLTRRR